MNVAGIQVAVTPAASPSSKPHIERFFLTLRDQFFSTLPGYIPKRDQGPAHPRLKVPKTVLSIDEVNRKLEEFVQSVYHDSYHRGLGCSPLEEWEHGLDRFGPPPVPLNIEKLYMLRCNVERRVLERSGVVRNRVSYFNQELHDLAVSEGAFDSSRKKREVRVLFDKEDIGSVTVVYPSQNGERIFEASSSLPWTHGMAESTWNSLEAREKINGPDLNSGRRVERKKRTLEGKSGKAKRRPGVNMKKSNDVGDSLRLITATTASEQPSDSNGDIASLVDAFISNLESPK